MKKIVLLFFVLLNVIGYAQLNKSVFTQAQRDSIAAMFHVLGDTILSGTATINVGADSVIVPHNLGSAPSIANINVSPQEDISGFDYWVESITSTAFKIKISSTGYEALTEPISFSWQIFNADVSAITTGIDLITSLTDTVLTGIATINLGAEPAPDSVVVTYNHYETDPPSDTGKVIIVPLSDMKGFNYWVKWATSEQFEIKIGDTGYEAITSAIYFRYYAIVRRR